MLLRRIPAVLACASLGACASMGTRDALVSDRPDFTESAATIAPRHVQLESGTTSSHEGAAVATSFGEVLVRAGLSSKLELRVGGNSFVRERADGVTTSGREDGSIGVKYAIVGEADGPSWRPAFSVIAHTTVPSGSTAFRTNHAQPEVKLIGAWSLSDRLGFSSNLNVARPHDGLRSFTEYAASASFGYAVSERVGAYAEGFGFAPQDGSNLITRYVNGGLTFLFSPDVQLDARVGTGRAVKAGDWFAGVGIVVRR